VVLLAAAILTLTLEDPSGMRMRIVA